LEVDLVTSLGGNLCTHARKDLHAGTGERGEVVKFKAKEKGFLKPQKKERIKF
jgi:hypothetical protein